MQCIENFAMYLLKIGCTICVIGFIMIVIAFILYAVANVLN